MSAGFVGSGTKIKQAPLNQASGTVNALGSTDAPANGIVMPTAGKMITGGAGKGINPVVAAPAPYKNVGQEYDKQVKSFRDNLPQLQESLFNTATGQAKNQLAGQMADITNQSNRRGLLYGGLHQGADNEAKAGIAGQLGQQRLEINNLTQGLADQFENQQINQGLEKYRGDVDFSQKLYDQAVGRSNFDAQQRSGLLGGVGSVIGAIFSDENLKNNIKSGDETSQEILDSIGNHKYEYKDKKHGEGTYLSPMAQELEKTEAGKSMVIDTPEGKMVDYGRGLGTIMAMQSYLNKRLKKIESKNELA